MARAFETRPARAPRPAAAQRPAAATRTVPPAADFPQLARRLHLGAPIQRRASDGPGRDFSDIAGPGRPPTPGGLPAGLRADVEARSGLPMDDVRVHRNSPKPWTIGALAYAQGRDIHLGPGQEKHLAHEAWHVVQQKQGRVRTTSRLSDFAISDDRALEREADDAASRSAAANAPVVGWAHRGRLGDTTAAPCQRVRITSPIDDADRDLSLAQFALSDRSTFDSVVALLRSKEPGALQTLLHGYPTSIGIVALDSHEIEFLRHRDEEGIEALRAGAYHPLMEDDNTIATPLLNRLRQIDPHGTLADLAIESTAGASTIMNDYRLRRGPTGSADASLFQSILAAAELHRRGATAELVSGHLRRERTEIEESLFNVVQDPYNRKEELVKAYGLTQEEVLAIEAYSEANKSNTSNRYYMGTDKKWGPFKDGWNALESAFTKIPSLGQLGMIATSYRSSRTPVEAQNIMALSTETNIRHGMTAMNMGQKHYTSTAMTYSVHAMRAEDNGGMLAFTGTSGRYINPFGLQAFSTDGGEILYPPGIVTRYEGRKPDGLKGDGRSVPVLHLQEVPGPESHQAVVEDEGYTEQAPRHADLDRQKLSLIDAFARMADQDAGVAAFLRQELRGREVMYLTSDELGQISQALTLFVQHRNAAI